MKKVELAPLILYLNFEPGTYDAAAASRPNYKPISVIVDTAEYASKMWRECAPNLRVKPEFIVINSKALSEFLGSNVGRSRWFAAALVEHLGEGFSISSVSNIPCLCSSRVVGSDSFPKKGFVEKPTFVSFQITTVGSK